MTDHDIDDERAALITKRIGQGFDFVRDVIDFPKILEMIPDKSQLLFRDFDIEGIDVRLAAYASPDRAGLWEARVTGPTWLAREMNRDQVTGSTDEDAPVAALGGVGPAIGHTAEDALDDLETRVRSSVTAEKLRASA